MEPYDSTDGYVSKKMTAASSNSVTKVVNQMEAVRKVHLIFLENLIVYRME